jgi:hypothetical protein
MGIRDFAAALAPIVSWPAPALAQQPAASIPEFEVERKAARADQMQAEKLFVAGEQGPQSKPCRLMDSYFLHLVKAAVAAGADTRIAAWPKLTPQERDAVKQKAPEQWERNIRLRQVVCRAKS